jgi:flagellar FliJ protein
MKKFVFTLQALLNYKLTLERVQKADLSVAEAALRALQEEDRRLDEAFEESKRSLAQALESGFAVIERLREHDAYFIYIRDEKARLKIEIEEAEVERDRLREILVRTMKEIKTYNKLRREQYERYLKEVAAEEEKAISDLVSFRAGSG